MGRMNIPRRWEFFLLLEGAEDERNEIEAGLSWVLCLRIRKTKKSKRRFQGIWQFSLPMHTHPLDILIFALVSFSSHIRAKLEENQITVKFGCFFFSSSSPFDPILLRLYAMIWWYASSTIFSSSSWTFNHFTVVSNCCRIDARTYIYIAARYDLWTLCKTFFYSIFHANE